MRPGSVIMSLTLVWLGPGLAPGQDDPHPGYSPALMQAQAAERRGKVVIQLYRPGPAVPSADTQPEAGKRWPTVWIPLRPVTLGETVTAFDTLGKPVDRRTVLMLLEKSRGVALFLRTYENDPVVPAPYYRDLIREGTLLLVARPDDLDNARP